MARKRTIRMIARPALRGRPGNSGGHCGTGRQPPRSSPPGPRASPPAPRPSPPDAPGPRASPPGPPRRPPPWRKPGRIVHNVRPSSSLNENGRTPSSRRRSNNSEAPMRCPRASSSASGTRRRCDQSRRAASWTSADVSAPGSELPSSSAQAPSRSLATCSLRLRSSSRWRSTIQPDTSANSSNTTRTVA